MPRLMAVSLTEAQVRARTKTVTRRLGWTFLRPCDRLTLCRKVMGRRRADGTVEPLERICDVHVTSVRRVTVVVGADARALFWMHGFGAVVRTTFVSCPCGYRRHWRTDTISPLKN